MAWFSSHRQNAKHTFVLPFDVKKNLGCATKVLCLAWEEEDAACLLGQGWISGCPSAPLISSLTAPRSHLTDLWVQVLKTRFPEGTSTCERMRCLLFLLFLAVRCYFVFTALCLSIRLPSGWNYSVTHSINCRPCQRSGVVFVKLTSIKMTFQRKFFW